MVQRRHWCGTINIGHLVGDDSEESFKEALAECWAKLGDDTRLAFACGQTEVGGESGRLHAQVYLEFTTSLRKTQVLKVLNGSFEPRWGSRTQAREYHTKSLTRVEALPDVGEFRKERSHGGETREGPKARCLRMLTQEGLTPSDIALSDPEAYFTFHRSIHALYDALTASPAMVNWVDRAKHE